ncbi:hypothetical protein C8R46DRAFT_1320440 [Mycena filopes]|nr:hypothetical protein C8R46DRAFT_1320440 [Mycena filopes]
MSALFTPMKLGSTSISNRIGMSALTRNRSSKTVPNEVMLKYYVQPATGGAGLIVSEGTLVSRQGTEWPNTPGIWDKSHIEGWKKITGAVHEAGSKIYAQLWHLGRISHPDAPEQITAGIPVYAPSVISARGGKFRHIAGEPGYVQPTEIPDHMVLIAQFKQAVSAKEAGFDGVELHSANGYLVDQFLDLGVNQRTDKWGGSVENRTRFALETLKALIEVFGADVAIKISPAGGYNDVGMPLQDMIDTFGHLLPEADKKGPLPHQDPLWMNSGFTPAEAEALVSSGKLAGVFFGKNWISHPDFARRVRDGKELNNVLRFATLYGAEGVDPELGYVDYKEAVY